MHEIALYSIYFPYGTSWSHMYWVLKFASLYEETQ